MFCFSGTLAPEVRDNGDGTYDVTYVPPTEGSNVKAKITWDGKDIPNRYGFKHIYLCNLHTSLPQKSCLRVSEYYSLVSFDMLDFIMLFCIVD
jgi:hypothetical protein